MAASSGFPFTKEASQDSLTSLEDVSTTQIESDELEEDLKEQMEVPSDVEEVEVEGTVDEIHDEWMDVIGSGDLKKKIIIPGIVESRPVKGDTVCIELIVKLEDGTLIEDSHAVTFALGDSEVIQGLDMIVPLMDRGERSEVFMAARFAYGSKGETDRVPPDAALLCTVNLLDFKPEESPEDLNVADRQQVGNRKRVRGNWWFNRGDYAEAVQCYKAAVDFLDDTEEIVIGQEIRAEVRALLEERLKALNNMAAAQIKLKALDPALVSLNAVLSCQPNNVKALFRKAKALQLKGTDLKEAQQCLKKALSLEPENKTIHAELAKLNERLRAEADNERSLYRRMLGVTGTAKKEQTRYPTLDLTPYRVFFSSFVVILLSLLFFSYKEDLWSFPI